MRYPYVCKYMNDTGTRPNRCRLAQITDGSDGIHLLHVRTYSAGRYVVA